MRSTCLEGLDGASGSDVGGVGDGGSGERCNRPLAATRNLRRSVITLASSHCHELVVGAFGDVVPGAHQRLELREGGVHLPGHGSLL